MENVFPVMHSYYFSFLFLNVETGTKPVTIDPEVYTARIPSAENDDNLSLQMLSSRVKRLIN